jgi:hypothetical protein
VLPGSVNFAPLAAAGCLANADLGGLAVDSTVPSCRDLIWAQFVLPNYAAQGVSAFWLDETDGAGTAASHGYDTSFGPAAAFSQLWIGSWLSLFARPVSALGEAPLRLTRGVWAGGDCAATGGIDLTVQAVQDGKTAAAAIDAEFARTAVKAA